MNKKVLLIISVIFCLVGCGKLNTSSYDAKIKSLGYTNTKINKSDKDTIKCIDGVVSKKDNINIKFYEFNSKKEAKKFYDNIKNTIPIEKKFKNTKKENMLFNKSAFSIYSYNNYWYITLKDNTVLAASVNKNDKNILEKTYKKLGY